MKVSISLLLVFLLASTALPLAVDAGNPGGLSVPSSAGFQPSSVLLWRTENYLMKVDEITDAGYCLTLWEGSKEIDDIPDLILTDGIFVRDGSGGNHYYQFSHHDLVYRCYVVWLGTAESPPGFFITLAEDLEIEREPVLEVVDTD